MMTLLGKALGAFSPRLWIEFLLIAAIVALGGYAVFAKGERDALTERTGLLQESIGQLGSQLGQQIDINLAQDQAIDRLRELRGIDSGAIAGLQSELGNVSARDRALRQRIATLEESNAEAKALLDTAVPDALGCLLDGRDCPAPHGDENPR